MVKTLTPEEAIIFKTDIEKIATELSRFLAKFIGDNPGFSSEALVYSMLGSASFVASSTGCSEETFLDLAEVAFVSESANDELLINVPSLSPKDNKLN